MVLEANRLGRNAEGKYLGTRIFSYRRRVDLAQRSRFLEEQKLSVGSISIRIVTDFTPRDDTGKLEPFVCPLNHHGT